MLPCSVKCLATYRNFIVHRSFLLRSCIIFDYEDSLISGSPSKTVFFGGPHYKKSVPWVADG